MKIKILIILFSLFPLFAQAQLLWKITGKNLKKPSYLYGTMHTSHEKAFKLVDSLVVRIVTCETYAGEMIFDPAMLFAVMQQLFMGKDTTLQTLLSAEEYAVVKKTIDEKLGMMAPMIDRMKPMFTSVLIQAGDMENLMATADKPQRKPLDLHLQDEATKKSLSLVGLETLEEQMDVFNGIPLANQAKMLYREIVNLDKKIGDGDTSMEKMLDWYAAQKLDSLYQYASKEFANEPALSYRILTKRNLIMADRIEKLIVEKSVFIAIGAAHLPDKQGVIELLRKKKFKVEAVKL
ncbi:MAG: TraB/GumN family protein [Cytophagales bacterium]|nr:MAG: TraB/GumN family protein [Cytophagales bacterium]